MNARWGRAWFAVTAACVVAGVTLSVVTSVRHGGGAFAGGTARGFNTLAFFTIQSNLLVGVTAVALAVRLDRRSVAFRTLRLMGVVAITLTGVVYHVALSGLLELDTLDQLGNQLVHTVVPLLAVSAWLVVGPRRTTSAPVAGLSMIFPLLWLLFTLLRGAAIHWYPYPFLDVTAIGYVKAVVNCFWVALLLLGVAAGYTVLDRHLAGGVEGQAGPRPAEAPVTAPGGTGPGAVPPGSRGDG